MLKFRVVSSSSEISGRGFYLVPDNWDDWFEFEISYWLWVKTNDRKCIGRLKIAEKNQTVRKTSLEDEFYTLGENYVSVGFNEDYYESLKQTKYREQILQALNDIAYNLEIYQEVQQQRVTRISLMREYSESTLKGQIHRMALGGARLTDYDFAYILPSKNPLTNENAKMTFTVERDRKPFSNIHVLIGKNGIGKTTVLKRMIYALEKSRPLEEVGSVENDWDSDFANIVFVSFSAFDAGVFEEEFQEEIPVPYKFVGLLTNNSIKSRDSLAKEFVDCSFEFYQNTSKMRLWRESIKILQSDNTFVEQGIENWISESIKKSWLSELKIDIKNEDALSAEERRNLLRRKHNDRVWPLFSKLSSGHKIILLTLANLIDLVEEKTIVLLDEPEEHLHPPLVAAFIQALSNLLIYRNGVGVIATHSPVIVQEVPRRCVWILNRVGNYLIPTRPEFETFGENLGELTTEIFGYEVTNAGFHKELKEAVRISDSYEKATTIFGNELGKEAKSILRAYTYEKKEDISE